MRKQTRPEEPEVLRKHAAKWNDQWRKRREENPKAAFNWYAADKKSVRDWLLPILRQMTQSHCSFCDTFPLDDRSTEPVEHFKPKSDPRFYEEAYSWANLYYCCELCQSSKGEDWDDALLRPDAHDYLFVKYFTFDYTTGEMKPNDQVVEEGDRSRAETTIRLYGLDCEPRRRRRREELRKWQRSRDRVLDEWAYRDFLEGGPE